MSTVTGVYNNMSYLAVVNLSVNNEFVTRFAAALVSYVPTVLAENPTLPNHAERVAQAIKVLDAPHSHANRLALAAASQFQGVMPTDAQLDAIVIQYWDVLALAPKVS